VASLYRRITTRRLSPTGKVGSTRKDGTAPAKWIDSRGKTHECEVKRAADGSWRLLTDCYYANFRDHTGRPVVVTTGCTDRLAAEAVLASLVRDAERVKAGILTAPESRHAREKQSIACIVTEYLKHQQARDLSSQHQGNQRRALTRYLADERPASPASITRYRLESWLLNLKKSGMGHRNINIHRAAVLAFLRWCIRSERLTSLSGTDLTKPMQESSDVRRSRRALTLEEVNRLCQAAEHSGRPVGLHRAQFYRVAAWTGLRLEEIKALKVQDFDLDTLTYRLAGESTKSGKPVLLPIHPALAESLRAWITSQRLTPDAPLITHGRNLLRSFKADCRRAGIPLEVQGRTIDIHALRHTFITWLAAAGVPMRVAQHLARHSRIELTASRYTDTALLPAREALGMVPSVTADRALESPKIDPENKKS